MAVKFLDFKNPAIRNAVSSVVFSDRHAVQYSVVDGTANSFIRITRFLAEKSPGEFVLSLSLKNISKEPVFLKEAIPLDISCGYGGMLDLKKTPTHWMFFGNGMYVLPTGGVQKISNLRWNYYSHELYGAEYAVIANRLTGDCLTLGFLTFRRQHGAIRLRCEQDIYNFEYLKAICEFDGYRLDPGAETSTERLYLNLQDKPADGLRKYQDLVLQENQPLRKFRNALGWGSWDYYHSKITEDDVLENTVWLAKHRRDFPIEYIQLDHGYEICEGDWLETNANFPHGLKWLASEIKRYGFKAGIWVCPFLAAPESSVFKAHPDWVIRDRAGVPVKVLGYAVPEVYILDCSIPEACEWVKELGRKITREYGFEYVKLDGANVQPMSITGVLADKKMTRAGAMRRGLEKFREGLGEDTFLLNGCLWGASLGIVDAMRIGPDVGARWDHSKLDSGGGKDDYPGSGSIYQPLFSTVDRFSFHNRYWVNDPDYLIARQKGSRSELTYEEARTWVSVVGMSGGLIMLGDRMTELNRKGRELLKKVIPQYQDGAESVGFLGMENPWAEHSNILKLKVENETEKWLVVCILNIDPVSKSREYRCGFAALGLAGDRPYHVFDFWQEEYLGAFSGGFQSGLLAPHDCRLLSIREQKDVPQVIATDTHFTQGGIEIRRADYDGGTGRLVIRTSDCRKKGTVYVYLPEGYRPSDRSGEAAGRLVGFPFKADGRDITLNFVKS